MKRFFVKLALFLAPACVVIAFPLAVLLRSGEVQSLDVEAVVDRQRRDDVLYGPAYTDCTKRYKLVGAIAADADVLVVGTSRAMQFRSALFPARVSFYNAGGAASRIDHYAEFLSRLPPQQTPELMIISLDQWFFNRQTHARASAPYADQVASCSGLLNLVQGSWSEVYTDYASGDIPISVLEEAPRAIGLAAAVHQNGFRPDGSFYYGRVIAHRGDPSANPDFGYRDSLQRIQTGAARFEYGDEVPEELVASLATFLRDAADRGIHVVGFLPPYAPEIWDRMLASGHYDFIPRIAGAVAPHFAAHGHAVFDFTDIRPLGSSPDEFVDGIHASERAHVRMLAAMGEHDTELRRYIDLDLLESLMRESEDPLAIRGDRMR